MSRLALIWSVLLVLGVLPVAAQPAPDTSAYRAYTGEGEPVMLDSLVAHASEADVVLVGEVHRDPVAHTLHYALAERFLARRGAEMALSLEMFERDVQAVLDEYLGGFITEEHFRTAARAWPGYAESYRPLVELAREQRLPVIAANAPRRYANLVSREGRGALEALPAEARRWLPPLPYGEPSPAYRAQFEEVMGGMGEAHGAADTTEQASPHGSDSHENMLQAQVLWDASMAHVIAEELLRRPEALVMHVSGAFHVERGTGIAEHLARYRPGTRILSVVIRPASGPARRFDPDAHADLADFVVLTEPL